MTDNPSKPRRRWFQFSLRTLLVVITLVAGLMVAWRVYTEPYRRQREAMGLIKELGGKYTTEPGGPEWMRDWFGADNLQNIALVDWRTALIPRSISGGNMGSGLICAYQDHLFEEGFFTQTTRDRSDIFVH